MLINRRNFKKSINNHLFPLQKPFLLPLIQQIHQNVRKRLSILSQIVINHIKHLTLQSLNMRLNYIQNAPLQQNIQLLLLFHLQSLFLIHFAHILLLLFRKADLEDLFKADLVSEFILYDILDLLHLKNVKFEEFHMNKLEKLINFLKIGFKFHLNIIIKP